MKQDEWIYQAFLEDYSGKLPMGVFFADDSGIIFASNISNREGLFSSLL